jgi:hypothetical protein
MSSRVRALSELVPFLPEIRHKALETAHDIKDDYCRFRALLILIPSFPEVIPEALDTFIRIQQDNIYGIDSYIYVVSFDFYGYGAYFDMAELAPYLPEHLLAEAFDSIRNLKVEDQRIRGVSCLAPYLPEHLLSEAFDSIRNLKVEDHHMKGVSLLGLAPYLPENLLSEALEMTRELDGCEDLQASIISKLAPNLSDNLWPKTLRMTENLWSKIGNKARFFVQLIPHIPDQLRGENRSFETDLNTALEIIYKMDMNERGYERAMVFYKLLPYLPISYLPNIELEAMEEIECLKQYFKHSTDNSFNNSLGKLVPYLTNKNLLNTVKILQITGDRQGASQSCKIDQSPQNKGLSHTSKA